jgi:hypothetical protein
MRGGLTTASEIASNLVVISGKIEGVLSSKAIDGFSLVGGGETAAT